MNNDTALTIQSRAVGEISAPADQLALAENYLDAASTGWLDELCTMIEINGIREAQNFRWEFNRDGFIFRMFASFDKRLNVYVQRDGREVHAVSDSGALPFYINGQWPDLVRREHTELELKRETERLIAARVQKTKLMLDTSSGI